jgi:hypothetical protein
MQHSTASYLATYVFVARVTHKIIVFVLAAPPLLMVVVYAQVPVYAQPAILDYTFNQVVTPVYV